MRSDADVVDIPLPPKADDWQWTEVPIILTDTRDNDKVPAYFVRNLQTCKALDAMPVSGMIAPIKKATKLARLVIEMAGPALENRRPMIFLIFHSTPFMDSLYKDRSIRDQHDITMKTSSTPRPSAKNGKT